MEKIDNRKDLYWLIPFAILVILLGYLQERDSEKKTIDLSGGNYKVEVFSIKNNHGTILLNKIPYKGISWRNKSLNFKHILFENLKNNAPFILTKKKENDTVYITKGARVYKFLINKFLSKGMHKVKVKKMSNDWSIVLLNDYIYNDISTKDISINTDTLFLFKDLKKMLPFELIKREGNDTVYVKKNSKEYKFLIDRNSF